MMTFLALAAIMVLVALAVVIVPLVRGDRVRATAGEDLAVLADGLRELEAERAAGDVDAAEFERGRLELERQALASQQQAQVQEQHSLRANWGAALGTAIVLPLLVIALYLTIGQPGTIGTNVLQARAGDDATQHVPNDAAVAALQARLAKDDGDVEGWVLLARSYFQMGRTDDALNAYRKATTLVADNPDLWVEYANTVAIAHNRDLSGEPTQMVERALKLDPNNFNALAFAGLAAFQRDDRATALEHWGRLKTLLPEGSEDSKRIDELIARARGDAPASAPTAAAGAAPASAPAKPAEARTAAAGTSTIRGTVTLSGALAAQVAASDTLYIFARAPNGPPMPLAAVRTRATGWPVSFTLDDTSAMTPGMQLSKFPHVNLVARISRLGNPAAQPGDIEGSIDNVAVGSKDVHIVMDRVVGR
ncbi:MAG: c-type cytochrome biogenesis protein CcmI [Comamonadaceae bacterium]|nr:c-type cytochrome biogenesis protein CcmI [Burkholderiales bacterium]MEB2349289.1 c-type cytochrome biogenesis protein CcmI [Comamonadaceae bacterium]